MDDQSYSGHVCFVFSLLKKNTPQVTEFPPNNKGRGKLMRTEAATEHPGDQSEGRSQLDLGV